MLDTTPSLRKRTKSLATTMLPEPTAEGSQLPSPLSSFDEGSVLAEPSAPFVRNPRHRRSSASAKGSTRARSNTVGPEEGSSSDAQWFDIPLAVAIIPLLGTFLTGGGDFLRDALLFILLLFYLHQLIKLPWELYLSSRPRGKRISRLDVTPEQQRLHDLAATELRIAEFCYLTLSVLSPLIGASLLRYVGTALTGKDYISWFSTGMFVLVTGIRPWRHLGHRLRSRTEELQDVVSTLHEDKPDNIPDRMAQLEADVLQLKAEMAMHSNMAELNKELDESLDVLDAAVGRHELAIELTKQTMEKRFAALEKAMGDALHELKSTSRTSFPPKALFEWIRPQSFTPPKSLPSKSSYRSIRVGYRPRLSPVKEEEDGSVQNRMRTRVLLSRARARRSIGEAWLDVFLFPFSVGRALLWSILDFLQRRLV